MSTTYKGPNRIKMYLQDKGVKDQWIQRALKIYTYDQQLETARTVVNKNDRVDRDSIQMRKKKHTDRLTRQGFTFDVIQEALAQFDWDRSDETVALEKIAEKQLRKLQRKYEGRELEQRFTQQLMQRGFQYQEIQAYLNKQTDMEE
ncbi:RecX family transcriptional regulator [Geomicrobium sp. JCM 19039]|uniref:RecX family transcriptional regulator n=1 Tax=Geomicrobium sp. JCM 19039 TaxID=1460636 RepID=UPI0005A5D28D|nr:RecX family transcriptional regulator [Geomicrobium sp. JCM 19039]